MYSLQRYKQVTVYRFTLIGLYGYNFSDALTWRKAREYLLITVVACYHHGVPLLSTKQSSFAGKYRCVPVDGKVTVLEYLLIG